MCDVSDEEIMATLANSRKTIWVIEEWSYGTLRKKHHYHSERTYKQGRKHLRGYYSRNSIRAYKIIGARVDLDD